ncbi:PAS domain-containing sensor histidine kinase [Salinispira pacifica]|nr:PAS domain-containing sensor histidine kinase [Salinispira pacifica]
MRSLRRTLMMVLLALQLTHSAAQQFQVPDFASPTESIRLLLIASYHPAFPTWPVQREGLEERIREFEGNHQVNICLDVEFMDSKRLFSRVHFANFRNGLVEKLNNLPGYHGVLTADDNALHFVLENREELFPGIPLVFFGVNDADRAASAMKQPQISGVAERIPLEENIRFLKAAFSEPSAIYGISDGTNTGISDARLFRSMQKQFPETELRLLDLAVMSYRELKNTVKEISPSNPVILLDAYLDKQDTGMEFDQAVRFLTEDVRVPMFHVYEHGIGSGLTGGVVISHRLQAYHAMDLLIDMLGSGGDLVPPRLMSPPVRLMLDYNRWRSLGISLPAEWSNPQWVNKPLTIWDLYGIWALIAILLFAGLAILTVLLIGSRRKLILSREQIQREHRRYRTLFDEFSLGLWEEDLSAVRMFLEKLKSSHKGNFSDFLRRNPVLIQESIRDIRIIRVNDAVLKMYKARGEEELIRRLPEIFPPQAKDVFAQAMTRLFEGAGEFSSELLQRDLTGREFWVRFRLTILQGHGLDWRRALVSTEDIDEKIRNRHMLAESLREKETLLREMHHRIKNNLNTVSSLIDLQEEKIEDQRLRDVLDAARGRIYSISMMHELLYGSDTRNSVSLRDYFERIRDAVFSLHQDVINPQEFRQRAPVPELLADIELDISRMVPLGLIFNEILTNTIKHGKTPYERLTIDIKCRMNGNQAELLFQDNGGGNGGADSNSVTSQSRAGGLGLELIQVLGEQLGGDVLSQPVPGGFRVAVSFPLNAPE